MGRAMGSWLEVVHSEMPLDTADCRQIALHLYVQDMHTQPLFCKSGLQALFHTAYGWAQLCNACRLSTYHKVTTRVGIAPDVLHQA